jgi:hypothetical protein|tara:strand:- start:1210 stop:2154 length:945 start_codon:yes stop_codon:yes gene_type:complete
MTTLTYSPRFKSSELIANLVDSYWDTKGGIVTKPSIIEKPYEQAQRLDLRNTGDHVIVSLEGITENFITLGFQHLTVEAGMLVEFNTFTSRQMMYDHIDEVRRILLTKRFNPSDYLLDGFEEYANDTALRAIWGDTTTNSTLSLLTSARQYGTNSIRVVVGNGGNGEAYRGFPSTFTVKPYPRRLQQIRFFAKIDSGSDVIGVTLRDASNRSGLYRTWNTTIDDTSLFGGRTVNIDTTATSSAGTWDPTLIDEIAFTNLAANRTFDIDHIDLSTSEFQFVEYTGFKENTNTFQYWSAELRAKLRAHGESVPELS